MSTPSDPPTFDWLGVVSVVSHIFMWLFAGAASLLGYIFKIRLDGIEKQIENKLDYERVSEVAESAVNKYHERFAKELKDQSNEKHHDNLGRFDQQQQEVSRVEMRLSTRLARIENLLMHTRRDPEDLP